MAKLANGKKRQVIRVSTLAELINVLNNVEKVQRRMSHLLHIFTHHSLNIDISSETHLPYRNDIQQTRADLCRNLQVFEKAAAL